MTGYISVKDQGGRLLYSVPLRFRKHLDPLDKQGHNKFREWLVLAKTKREAIAIAKSYWSESMIYEINPDLPILATRIIAWGGGRIIEDEK